MDSGNIANGLIGGILLVNYSKKNEESLCYLKVKEKVQTLQSHQKLNINGAMSISKGG